MVKEKETYMFLIHICVCVYTPHRTSKQETRSSPGPPQKINGQKQMGAPFVEVGYEQKNKSDKQEKDGEELINWATLNQR